MEAVVRYLDRVDPDEAQRARARYSCFDHVGGEGQAYGYALAYSGAIPCENEVVTQLIELRRRAEGYLRRDGWVADDEFFFAEQNALLVRDAEEYYQQMYRADVSSWNLRDRHMAATLDSLAQHLNHQLGRAKFVVWEHNSHVGDARSTEMGARGELNVGQLARQRYGGECALIGLTTYDGTVTAATEWGGPSERKRVRPAMTDSHESFLHDAGIGRFWLDLADPTVHDAMLVAAPGAGNRGHLSPGDRTWESLLSCPSRRAVRCGHPSRPHPAVEPLERTSLWDAGEPPETYPTGL